MASLFNIKDITVSNSLNTQLFDQFITETIRLDEYQNKIGEIASILGATDTSILGKDQKFSTKLGWGSLKEIKENQIAPLRELTFWPKKGVYNKIYSEKIEMSEDFLLWVKSTKSLEGAPSDIQWEFITLGDNIREFIQAFDMTKVEVLLKVLTEWDKNNAPNGPWSLTPNGKKLFDTHVNAKDTAYNFKNFSAWSKTGSLQDMWDALKVGVDVLRSVRLDNGKKVASVVGLPSYYTVVCPVEQEGFLLRVLNNFSANSGMGSNSEQKNYFTFDWFGLRVKVIAEMWEPDANGVEVWDKEGIYIINDKYIKKAKALRYFTIDSSSGWKIKTFEDDETDGITTKGKIRFGADHYGLEYWVYKIKNK